MLIFKEEILNKAWINKAWPYIRPLGMVQKIQNSGYSLAKKQWQWEIPRLSGIYPDDLAKAE